MNNKSINAILLSLLQDLKGDPSASVAMVDTKDEAYHEVIEALSK